MLQLVCVRCRKVLDSDTNMRPSAIPCGHVLCVLCLEQILESKVNLEPKCPRCQQQFTARSCTRILLPRHAQEATGAGIPMAVALVDKGRELHKFFTNNGLEKYSDLVVFYERFASYVEELDRSAVASSFGTDFVHKMHGMRAFLHPIYEKALDMPSVRENGDHLRKQLLAAETELKTAKEVLDRVKMTLGSRKSVLVNLQRNH